MTSGQFTTADIGKTIYLSNSNIVCQEWQVADANHDGTSGTVDLFPKYTLTNNSTIFGNSQYYANSSVRTYLNGTVLSGFTAEIQNAMKVQNFPSNGSTLSDKVKCPSLMEVGFTWTDYAINEGTIYPLFGTSYIDKNSRANALAIRNAPNGGSCYYWTRSRRTNYSDYVWGVYYYGCCNGNCYNYYYYVVACIRF